MAFLSLKNVVFCRLLVSVGSLIASLSTLSFLCYSPPVEFTSTLKMEVACFFETLVPIYLTAGCHIPEDYIILIVMTG